MNYGTVSGIIGALGLVAAGGVYLTRDEPAPVVVGQLSPEEQLAEMMKPDPCDPEKPECSQKPKPVECVPTLVRQGNATEDSRAWICNGAVPPQNLQEYIEEHAKGEEVWKLDIVPVKPPPVEMLENGVQ